MALVDSIRDLARHPTLKTLQTSIERFTDYFSKEKYTRVMAPNIERLLIADDQPTNSLAVTNEMYQLLPALLPSLKHLQVSSIESHRLQYLRSQIFPDVDFDFGREQRVKIKFLLLDDDL